MEWEGMNEGERGGRGGEGEATGARRRRATTSEQRGGVNPTRHLVRARLFPPTTGGRLLSRGVDNGRRASYTPPYFLASPPRGVSNSNGAVCNPHTAPVFLLPPPESTKTMGRRDIHTPPPFFFFPPSGRQQKQRGRRDIHTPPTFSFFPPPGVDKDNGAA
jgi:hypothetical protein